MPLTTGAEKLVPARKPYWLPPGKVEYIFYAGGKYIYVGFAIVAKRSDVVAIYVWVWGGAYGNKKFFVLDCCDKR